MSNAHTAGWPNSSTPRPGHTREAAPPPVFITLICFLLFALTSVYAWSDGTRVYITRDANGNPVFSDTPTAGAETHDIRPVTTVPSVALPAPAPTKTSTQAANREYQRLTIISPADQSNIPAGLADQLTLSLQLTPDLQKGHTIVVLDNGAELSRGAKLDFSLTHLVRGEHRLTAEVRAANGEVLIRSLPRSIYIQRTSKF